MKRHSSSSMIFFSKKAFQNPFPSIFLASSINFLPIIFLFIDSYFHLEVTLSKPANNLPNPYLGYLSARFKNTWMTGSSFVVSGLIILLYEFYVRNLYFSMALNLGRVTFVSFYIPLNGCITTKICGLSVS